MASPQHWPPPIQAFLTSVIAKQPWGRAPWNAPLVAAQATGENPRLLPPDTGPAGSL